MSPVARARFSSATGGQAPPVARQGIPLSIQRVSGSGSCLVNTGICLYDTELTPATLAQAGLWINGAEVSCWLESLGRLHANGAIMWLLIQWTGDPATVFSCELRLTGSVAVRASKTTCPRIPAAYFLAGAHRVEGLPRGLRMVSRNDTKIPTAYKQFDNFYDTRIGWEAAANFTDWGNRLGVAAPYDHGATGIENGLRAASCAHINRQLTLAQTITDLSQTFTFINTSVQPYILVENWAFAWCYWMTGNPDYVTALSNHTYRMISVTLGNGWFQNAGTLFDDVTGSGDQRVPARALTGIVATLMCGGTFATISNNGWTYSGNDAGCRLFAEDCLRLIAYSDGFAGGTGLASDVGNIPGMKTFMASMLMTALIEVYELIFADSRIPVAIGKWITWTNTNHWVVGGKTGTDPNTYRYITRDCFVRTGQVDDREFILDNGSTGNSAGHGLNNMQLYPQMWYSIRTGDAALRTFLEGVANSCWQYRTYYNNSTLIQNTPNKAIDESWWRLNRVMALYKETIV